MTPARGLLCAVIGHATPVTTYQHPIRELTYWHSESGAFEHLRSDGRRGGQMSGDTDRFTREPFWKVDRPAILNRCSRCNSILSVE